MTDPHRETASTAPKTAKSANREWSRPAPGTRVVDRDGEDPEDSPAVVLATLDVAARDHYVDAADATVAALNPEYSPTAVVVEVAFLSDLRRHDVAADERAREGTLATVVHAHADLTAYSYPRPRLRVVAGPPEGAAERGGSA